MDEDKQGIKITVMDDAMRAERDADVNKRLKEQRLRDRAMNSSTFKAIAALEFGPPEAWEEGMLDEIIDDAIAVNKVRWHERVTWISVVVGVAMAAFGAAWYIKPAPEQVPMTFECAIEYEGGVGSDVDCMQEPVDE